jgi:hypothetical protein
MESNDLRAMLLNAAADPEDKEAALRFEQALGTCNDYRELTSLLSGHYEYVDGVVFRRLIEVMGTSNVDLLLAFTMWNYTYGYDGEAQRYLTKAKELAPRDKRVLQVEISLLWSAFARAFAKKANEYLVHYPDDEWILSSVGEISNFGGRMNLGPFNFKW